MGDPNITDWISAVGAILVPIVAAAIAFVLARHRARSEALTAARLEAYQAITPLLNRMMCYFTFIGRWKEFTPPEVIAMKRDCDELFHVTAPLFSDTTAKRYGDFTGACFTTFGQWGADARLRTSAARRREHAQPWEPLWDEWFVVRDGDLIEKTDLEAIRAKYDALLGALARDIQLQKPRTSYTTTSVVRNAHLPD